MFNFKLGKFKVDTPDVEFKFGILVEAEGHWGPT